jgi:hypothetical protein
MVASAVFLVLLALGMAVMRGQATLGKQQQTRAFGSADAQRVLDQVAATLRGSVYEPDPVLGADPHTGTEPEWPASSDLALPEPQPDNFTRLKLYKINSAPKGPFTTTAPFRLSIMYYTTPGPVGPLAGSWPTPYPPPVPPGGQGVFRFIVLGVEDPATGTWVANRTSTTVRGRLVVGFDTNDDGRPDQGTRTIAERVSRFVVSPRTAQPDMLDVTVALTLATGNLETGVSTTTSVQGGAEFLRAEARAHIVVNRFDRDIMRGE